ncbi:hypothetical protein JHK82_043850 [Glycine max]|uniref:Uncharacterized protein n=2 Tax=Glycine subgen. Soja TaxID=1462606 RepID=A0A0R0G681_SOYBN|nr:hypothetical protein JHK87_043645 [Glycine soja]KAG4950493.1 hypothetical protein JHK86_043732 [Glycine max]KAG4958017.1 hypothetical protein JHK85_044397 [Glycine max]KAG5106880.1 hypothetical protein JHK82_043850 [Glycine max]KAG5117804.1 hypothetical protein JHK84_043917 [Glycine max]
MLTKWKLAKVVSDLDRNHNQPHSVVTWEALELDAYKCNVDATFWSQVQLSLPSVIFEMDCKSIVDRVLTEVANVFECNFKVKFLRQQVNMVVHVLARTSIDYASPTLFNSMPTCIYHFIINDTS